MIINSILYLQIKNLDEQQLKIERKKLASVDSIVILDFVKQSVEILMEMRKSEFEEYQRSFDAKRLIQKNIDKRKAKELEDKNSDKKEPAKKPLLVSVKNSRFRQKLKQVADAMETPRTDVDENEVVPEQYEKQLQKLEDDVRRHIRIEQQLKLHAEQIQQQLDDAYKESIVQLHANQDEIDRLKLRVDQRDGKIRRLEKEIMPLQETAKKHEELVKEMKTLKEQQENDERDF